MRLDLKHSMELCLTMDRIPRAVVDCMWGRLTPAQEAAGIVEYERVSIEKAMHFLDLEPLHALGMKNGKLHKVSAPLTGPRHDSGRHFSLHEPVAPVHRCRRRSSRAPYFSSGPR